MLGRSERLARGSIAGSFAIATAAISHVVAGGGVPSGLALGTGAVFAVLLGTLAMGRRPSLPRLGVAVAGAQVAFHLVFSTLAPGVGAHAAGSHHGAPAGGSLDLVATVPHAENPTMWVAHAVAMVTTLIFLRHAERVVWRMVRRMAARLRSFDRIPAAVRPAADTRLPAGGDRPAARPAPFLAAFSLRGPPAPAAH